MSILIKGMDMPSLYKTYKVRFAKSDGGKIVVGIANEDSTEYTPAGEAVFVPPHGRLGDLDRLVEKIDGIWDCNDMVFSPNDHCCNVPEDCKGCKWIETKNYIRRMVANAPTIIPAAGRGERIATGPAAPRNDATGEGRV